MSCCSCINNNNNNNNIYLKSRIQTSSIDYIKEVLLLLVLLVLLRAGQWVTNLGTVVNRYGFIIIIINISLFAHIEQISIEQLNYYIHNIYNNK